MSNLDHAANLIGNYLLKGWVLMDDTCSTPSCSVPLMRSKDNKIKFCVLCDDPEKQSKSEPKKSPLSNEVQNTSEQEDDTYSAIKPDEAEKRRVQSQQASKLIGAKMLQGWAMMEDVCPNESCYGVPLIRSRQDKHLHCVICQKNYLREQDADVENSQSHQNPIDTKPAVPDNDAKPQMKDQIPPAPVVSQETHKEQPTPVAQSQKRNFAATSIYDHDAMVDTLSDKMNQLRNSLQTTNDPRLIKEICDAISSCSTAITNCMEVDVLL